MSEQGEPSGDTLRTSPHKAGQALARRLRSPNRIQGPPLLRYAVDPCMQPAADLARSYKAVITVGPGFVGIDTTATLPTLLY
ncbi:hypothetical protein [Actinomadura hibisca]|uniref:hypothetical protein n=1 Tax=Actinomadura hibisca TaxID=68565 RepID=UPI0012F79DAE|nr:hypothetical protein [Actinomadura hibisca]